ncbi:Chitosanase-domain-containing protein [Choiromyces venosus 120613-1]|uniref:Endo-chitosanase n=1 Tax=Choiromyces venosus 120613-1 TaxID=1336337 RepID=A0A3N4JFJ3_9PEZI|nr:Chitosanase-domain-containing protein [Choiromyces venosus 120613-1]
MKLAALLPLILSFAGIVLTRQIPQNLQTFLDEYKDGKCPIALKSGFQFSEKQAKSAKYCTAPDRKLIWIAGPNSLADMDIDCDGSNRSAGKCANDLTGQGQTAFRDNVARYGVEDLDSNKHSYIVFGNQGYSPSFEPTQYGVPELGIAVVVCAGQFFYAVWGDTNGGTLVGEASISLATACFDPSMTGNNGHTDRDVLYLAFTGNRAAPNSTVDWNANTFQDFENSLEPLGRPLLEEVCAGYNDGKGCSGEGSPTGSASPGTSSGTNKSGKNSAGARVIWRDAMMGWWLAFVLSGWGVGLC